MSWDTDLNIHSFRTEEIMIERYACYQEIKI